MGLVRFTDAPSGITSSKAKSLGSDSVAHLLISAAWKKWLTNPANSFPKEEEFSASLYDLSTALLQDNKYQIPFAECERLVEAFVDYSGALTCLKGHVRLASPRLQAMASEVVSVTSTILAAQRKGLCFVGIQDDVNRYFGGDPVWTKPWDGSGPDYLFSNFDGNATFVEVKGELSKPCTKLNPAKGIEGFVKQKVQSINAELQLPAEFPKPQLRYVLSRVRRACDDQVSVRWFNEREDSSNGQASDALTLAVALSNYEQLLRSLGVDLNRGDRSQIEDYRTLMPDEVRVASTPDYSYPPGTVFVPGIVFEAFRRIDVWFSAFRQVDRRHQAADIVEEARELKDALKNALSNHPSSQSVDLGKEVQARVVGLPMGFGVVV